MATKRKSAVKKSVTRAVTSITIPALKKGEQYIGAILGADGKGHHIILLPGDESGTWQAMMDSAKKRGGDLPNRIEQAMLFAHHKEKFQKAWYWSNTEYAPLSDYAWGQDFYGGYQFSGYKGGDSRARAVRRLPIQ